MYINEESYFGQISKVVSAHREVLLPCTRLL